MTVLTDLRVDLVERKLWPVAAALVVGAVAVPVAFGPGATPAPPAVAQAPGAAGGATSVRADDAPTPGLVAGVPPHRKDPFVDAGAAKATSDAPAGLDGPSSPPGPTVDVVQPIGAQPTAKGPSAPVPAGGEQAAPAGKAPAHAGPEPTTGVAHTPVESPTRVGAGAQVPDRQPWAAQLRVGARSPRAVRAMTPLPSADDPAVVYLGLLGHGRRAVLLLRDDVSSVGAGTCRPRKDSCQTLELAPGQHARLLVAGAVRPLTIRYRGALAPKGAPVARAAAHGRATKPKLVSALTTGRTYWLDVHGGTLKVSGRVSRQAAARARRRVVAAVAGTGTRRSAPDLTPDAPAAPARAVPLWDAPTAP